uniref:Major facilitator superfamily (MFS) profile domain-containing protein n=1 Tax=Grammatophora oceanica TaxID=210454 RepID=A0A7S1VBV2_9STRA
MYRNFVWWYEECAWPGMGLFGESYLLFSIGTLTPIWQQLYPQCYSEEEAEEQDASACNTDIVHSLTYSVVIGVILGMLVLGFLAGWIGRRAGSITTAAFMATGAWGLTLVSLWGEKSSGKQPTLVFSAMTGLLFVFGFGVGGEYPLSASLASEKSMVVGRLEPEEEEVEEDTTGDGIMLSNNGNKANAGQVVDVLVDDDNEVDNTKSNNNSRHDRGKRVQLVFMMQGMGIFCNCLVLVLLLVWIPDRLFAVWRITYAIGALVLTYVLWSRILHLRESQAWTDDLAAKQQHEQRENYRQNTTDLPTISVDPATGTVIGDDADDDDDTNYYTNFGQYGSRSQSPTSGGHQEQQETRPSSPMMGLLQFYSGRLIGTSLSWLLWDVAFYGNKLFQSTFLLAVFTSGNNNGAVVSDISVLDLSLAALLNAAVALIGYYGAAQLLDHPRVGRLVLQQVGFLGTGILFVACGFLYDPDDTRRRLEETIPIWNDDEDGIDNTILQQTQHGSGMPRWALMGLYLGTTLLGQLGPNATTFLIPAEVFPTEMRSWCHGIAAASGKVGALISAILFHSLSNETDLFLLSGYASLAAALITFLTIPDYTTLKDLQQVDILWRATLQGKRHECYTAELDVCDPRYQSRLERWVIRRSKHGGMDEVEENIEYLY